MLNTHPLKKTFFIFTLVGSLTINPLFVQADLGDQILKRGMNHEDIKVLQQHLIDLNHLDLEETTDYYGDLTTGAVASFQISQGLEVDGTFGPTTFGALKSIIEMSPLVYEYTLKAGMESESVKILQERLKILGFLEIEDCTTYFGEQTEQALKDFQDIYGIRVTGVANEETINALNDVLRGNKRKVKPFGNRGRSQTNKIGLNIVNTAKKYMGIPYRSSGASPAGFDCSGFTQYVFQQNSISIPRTSIDQSKIGQAIGKGDLKIGDLVIFKNTYRTGPSHTGIYIGQGSFIHSSSTNNRGVIISDLSSGYYNTKFHSGRRLF